MHTRQYDENHQKQSEHQNGWPNKKHASFVSTFSRIKPDQIGPIKTELQDNSFESKFKYGNGGDAWGKHGH